MGVPVVRPPVVRDRDDDYQRQVRAAIKILDAPGSRKVTVKGVTLGASVTLVRHQLGKLPEAWQVIDLDADVRIWRDPTIPTTADVIPLRASAAVTVNLQFW